MQPVPCVNCGKQPTITKDDIEPSFTWVTCDNCYDCDYDGERGYVGNRYAVCSPNKLAISDWNEAMEEMS